MPDTVGLEYHEPASLRGITKRAIVCKHHRFRDLYRCIDSELLHSSWRELNKRSASGVDEVTAEAYAKNLDDNIQDLVERLKTKRYRTKLVRRCYIPKENGKERALGLPALEDKLVQQACAKLLNAIYEPLFLPNSYGYRKGIGAKDAVMDLCFNLQYGRFGYIVEADIKGFFDHLDHDWLLKMLALKIDDNALLMLIRKWLKAGILDTDGTITHPVTGTPQGGVISPILANIYLHYALDLWFQQRVKRGASGQCMMIRYADDFVCAFQYRADAMRFYRELPKRLAIFQLEVAPEKSRVMAFSRFTPGLPKRFSFLGFEVYWDRDRKGVARVKKRTASKKLQAAKRALKVWIRGNRHLKGPAFVVGLNRKLVGHYNYFGLKGNLSALYNYYIWTIRCAYKWLNRRGGKRNSFNWGQFGKALTQLNIAKPRETEKWRKHVVFT